MSVFFPSRAARREVQKKHLISGGNRGKRATANSKGSRAGIETGKKSRISLRDACVVAVGLGRADIALRAEEGRSYYSPLDPGRVRGDAVSRDRAACCAGCQRLRQPSGCDTTAVSRGRPPRQREGASQNGLRGLFVAGSWPGEKEREREERNVCTACSPT